MTGLPPDDARWALVQSLFHAAAALPASERKAFLDDATAHDDLLVAEVLDLLSRDEADAELLDHGVAHVAAHLLGGDRPGEPSVPDFVAGRSFGPYRLTGFLGEGGAGVVYRAERTDIGGVAAVKILRDAALSPARRARFAAEQRTLVRLRHPGIAQIYHADTLPDGTPWFAMELVEGATLTEHCEVHRASLDERLRLTTLVCDAVQYAHGHAIIHRDLKPSNILGTADGAVRLLDFGVAKRLDLDTDSADFTRTGLRVLTPAYAAPEQSTNAPVGVHTDVYSLGVILFELLTGRLPFEPGDTRVTSEPPRPSTVVRRHGGPLDLTQTQWADLDVLVMTAMQTDPGRRYRTVDALRGDITRFRTGRPLMARPDSRRYRAGKFLRRNRRAVALTAAGVLSIVALTTFFTLRLASARDAALLEAARTARIQDFMLSLFQGGDPDVLAADSLRVLTLLERGLREARALDADPAVQGALVATLGGIYRQLGEIERADSLLLAALAIEQSVSGPASPDVARRLLDLAMLRIDQADYAQAESLARDAHAIATRALPPDHDVTLTALTVLGTAQQERGEYDHAVETLERALRGRGSGDTLSASYAGTVVQLANTFFYAGDYDRADSLNRKALTLHQRQRGESHPLVADILINLGAIRFQRGAYDEAERHYREALDIIEPWYGADHHATAAALTMLGRSLVMQKRADDALPYLTRALDINEMVHGTAHPSVASVLNELGTVALGSGRLDEAEQRYRRMLDIYGRIHGEGHWLLGIAQSNLGAVATEREDHSAAERLFRQAIKTFSASQGDTHINTGIGRIKLGRALLRQGRPDDAIPELEAGLTIVESQAGPSVSWAASARADLEEARSAATGSQH